MKETHPYKRKDLIIFVLLTNTCINLYLPPTMDDTQPQFATKTTAEI